MKRVFIASLVFISALDLVSCKKSEPKNEQFGLFSVGGKTLISQAETEMSYNEAKDFLTKIMMNQNRGEKSLLSRRDNTLPSDEASRILSEYGGVEIDYTYFDINGDEKNGTFKLDGSDFAIHVRSGQIPLFYGISITDLVANPEILDYYQLQNEEFKKLPNYEVFPFANIYTYHQTFDKSSFVLQVHDFTELPNSVGYASGFSSTYIKENEVVYDSTSRLITLYQTSQGIKLQYPDGTGLYGALFKAQFAWIPKTNNN